ncbi:MAG: hypothetical protein AAF555_02820 [Verrucomicrobiota bacterium]
MNLSRSSRPDASELVAYTVTPATLSCALGVVVGSSLTKKTARGVAAGLLLAGVGALAPVAVRYVQRRLKMGPGKESQALSGIRAAGGSLPEEMEVYDQQAAEKVFAK